MVRIQGVSEVGRVASPPGASSLRSPEPVPVSAHAGDGPSRKDFAPCPLCKQYSHSIGEDALADAFNHFQSMCAHPVRGHPMGHWFDEKTREAAQVLMAAARHAVTMDQVRSLARERIGTGVLREWCSEHGVNSTHASEFLKGTRARPPADLLNALDLEWRIVRKPACNSDMASAREGWRAVGPEVFAGTTFESRAEREARLRDSGSRSESRDANAARAEGRQSGDCEAGASPEQEQQP